MTTKSSYCRFCAKEQTMHSILDLKTSREQHSILMKLRIFTEDIVDFRNKYLPETICIDCCRLLDISYGFYAQAKEAQITLNRVCVDDILIKEGPSAMAPLKEEFDNLAINNFINIDIKTGDSNVSWSAYSWSCRVCEATMPSLQELRTHSEEVHQVCCLFSCTDCDEQMFRFEEFVEHVRQHRPYLRKYCQYCNIKMESTSHTETHTCMYNCTFCGQIFQTESLLFSHLKEYAPERFKNFELFSVTFKNNTDTDIRVDDYTKKIFDMYSHNNNNSVLKNILQQNDTRTILNDIHTEANDTQKIVNNTQSAQNDETYQSSMNNNVEYRKFKQNKSQEIKDFNENEGESVKVEKAEDYKNKIIKVWSDYPRICKKCNKISNVDLIRKHSVRRHRKCFTTKCIDCDDDTLETFEQFMSHVEKHRPYLKKICYYCDATYTDKEHLLKHKRHYRCRGCGHDFRRLRDLTQHNDTLETPLPLPPPKVREKPDKKEDSQETTCPTCFKIVKHLKNHLSIHKNRTKDHVCDRCGKSFYTKKSLVSHRIIHDGEKKDQCKICGKSFISILRLKRHLLSHNLIKPFQCDHCKKFYNSKNNLSSHMKVHYDLRAYECPYCPKRFKNTSTLKVHMVLHTGPANYPYSCDECEVKFANWPNYNLHKKGVHGVSMAKRVRTAYGMVDLDTQTGRAKEISLSSDVQEWTKNMLKNQKKKKDNII